MKIAFIVLCLLVLAACGGKEVAPSNDASDNFTIISASLDQATNSLMINIRIEGLLNQDSVKTAAEAVIARNHNSYRNITVKSFAPNARETDLPYATSVLQDGVINHKFNPLAAPQKIPTH